MSKFDAEAKITGVIFLLPAVIIFSIFVIWPIIQSAYYSFYSWNGIGPPTQFVGADNYKRLLVDPVFWQALKNNAFVVIWFLTIHIPLGVSLAILLTSQIKGASFFYTLYLSPLMLSSVVVGLLWRWIYNPTFGLANSFLRTIGLEQYTSSWLGDDNIVLACVMVASTWRDLGFYIVLFSAAIQGIPKEMYEAAQVDGATSWELHRYITLPFLKPTILVAISLNIIASLQFFDLIWILTQGGPYHSSEVLTTYMFKMAFRLADWGYATTLAFVLFGITYTFIISFIGLTQIRKRSE